MLPDINEPTGLFGSFGSQVIGNYEFQSSVMIVNLITLQWPKDPVIDISRNPLQTRAHCLYNAPECQITLVYSINRF